MKNKDSGFSTAFAMSVIFSLSILTLSFAMIVAANDKKINSYKKFVTERKKVEAIINSIGDVLQGMKESSSDVDIFQISSLVNSVCNFDFSIKDVSTGINKNFTSHEILKSKNIDEYLSLEGDKGFVEYGWINPLFADKDLLETVTKDFENTFPLINKLPPLNIHFMNSNFIKIVLEYYKLKDIDIKIEHIQENLNSLTEVEKLAALLEINENHPVFDLIGFKTAFWQISFETEHFYCKCIFAAVPEIENQKKIEKYMLVSKEILAKGGVNE